MNQMNRTILFLLAFAVALLLLVGSFSAARASTYVPVEDDAVYAVLARLEAEGVIASGLLDTKPISRTEARRLLREAEADPRSAGGFTGELVRSLRDLLGPAPAAGATLARPLDRAYAGLAYTNAAVRALSYGAARENEQPLNENNDGDLYRRGLNGRAGFTSRLDDWGPLSVELNPEYRYPAASYTGLDDAQHEKDELTFRKAYAVLGLGWDVVLGRDSQWWGPGYHGALLLTDNAEPLTMLKLTNPGPGRLPWIFDGLGPFRFTFFVSRLEAARPVPKPYLYGLRFDFKPSPYIEIALEKTALLGGKGREDNFRTWVDSLFSRSHGGQDYNSPGYVNIDDERAGIDLKLTVPWRVQPFQFYVEADGEDESARLPVPQTWAFLGGLYLPEIGGAERLDLRLEYATTRGRTNAPYVWYTHGVWTAYTYEGNIIGHHIGTDGDDLFAELSWLLPARNGRLFLSWDREEHDLGVSGGHETLDDVAAGFLLAVAKRVDLGARYSRGLLRNPGNEPGPATWLSAFDATAAYRF